MESDLKVEDVFSLRRPKDIKAGLASGLKSVAKGVVGGTVGLLAAPTVGAMQDGLPGFARGIATGEGKILGIGVLDYAICGQQEAATHRYVCTQRAASIDLHKHCQWVVMLPLWYSLSAQPVGS